MAITPAERPKIVKKRTKRFIRHQNDRQQDGHYSRRAPQDRQEADQALHPSPERPSARWPLLPPSAPRSSRSGPSASSVIRATGMTRSSKTGGVPRVSTTG